MDKELAEMIVQRYLAVLEETSGMVSGIPESRLPCDQSLIKEAIQYILTDTSKYSEEYMDLQNAYSKLGLFITDAQADMVAKAESAINTMDPMDEGFKYLGQHAAMQKKIQDDMYLLTVELNDFIKQQVD